MRFNASSSRRSQITTLAPSDAKSFAVVPLHAKCSSCDERYFVVNRSIASSLLPQLRVLMLIEQHIDLSLRPYT